MVQPQVNGIPFNRRLTIVSARSDVCGASNSTWSDMFIFGLTQELLREVWSPRQGICLFTPCVGSFTSPGIDTR